jgi:hypothetical protein
MDASTTRRRMRRSAIAASADASGFIVDRFLEIILPRGSEQLVATAIKAFLRSSA